MTLPADKAMTEYQRLRRIVLAAVISVIAIFLIFGRSSQPEEIHERIEWLGQMLILIGIGGRMWSTLYIGGRKSSEVVQTGPYSITRNPLYFFSAIAAAGVGGQMGSLILTAVFGILCWIAFSIVIRKEEGFLEAKLGKPYLDYAARVPRFLPNPSLYRDEELVSFRPTLLLRTLKDGLAFFLSVPLFELIETLQNKGVIPVLFHLW
ncbi:MAG: isoprenylcysteine carboxylmethyltransferase family protein [Rhizobiaceae bacterium]|nr:isoprenylcysteine carboxylmethyltransferase family protein [Rhizobiaceae bacterium]